MSARTVRRLRRTFQLRKGLLGHQSIKISPSDPKIEGSFQLRKVSNSDSPREGNEENQGICLADWNPWNPTKFHHYFHAEPLLERFYDVLSYRHRAKSTEKVGAPSAKPKIKSSPTNSKTVAVVVVLLKSITGTFVT